MSRSCRSHRDRAQTTSDLPAFWTVIPAAGVGSRMRADRPKQYLDLA
ncbi:2-C-methyl-D-erythritol 4-phosphate cytidylyltransferase, partial [Pseudomonas aeruginosa]|nr:2-C-methyl-D-erythritol 4-phosphate cytidylyltransferase [Pseudomonas aeruginosa]